MIADPERYRLVAASLHGVATVAILCAICNESEDTEPVIVFDYLGPSIADVQAAAEEHEARAHGGAA